MNEQEYTIKGWVARDCYGIWLYKQKPYRIKGKHTSHWTDEFGPNSEYRLNEEFFQNSLGKTSQSKLNLQSRRYE